MFFRRSGVPEELYLKIDAHIPPESYSEDEKKYVKNLFIRLVVFLILTDLCIAAVFLLKEPIFAVPGIYFSYRALADILRYGSIVLGSGLKTTLYVFNKLIRVTDYRGISKDHPYSEVINCIYHENGLAIVFKEGGFFADADNLALCEQLKEILEVLKKKLGSRFKDSTSTEEYKRQKAEAEAERAQRRTEALGSLIEDITYEPDGADFRAYCRLLLHTGREQKVTSAATALLGALTAALPIVSLMTDLYILESVAFITLVLLGMILFVKKIGIASPAKQRFRWGKNRLITVYLHEGGIAVVNRGMLFIFKWSDIEEARFHEKYGIAVDAGRDGVIYMPADLVSPEAAELLENRYNKWRE